MVLPSGEQVARPVELLEQHDAGERVGEGQARERETARGRRALSPRVQRRGPTRSRTPSGPRRRRSDSQAASSSVVRSPPALVERHHGVPGTQVLRIASRLLGQRPASGPPAGRPPAAPAPARTARWRDILPAYSSASSSSAPGARRPTQSSSTPFIASRRHRISVRREMPEHARPRATRCRPRRPAPTARTGARPPRAAVTRSAASSATRGPGVGAEGRGRRARSPCRRPAAARPGEHGLELAEVARPRVRGEQPLGLAVEDQPPVEPAAAPGAARRGRTAGCPPGRLPQRRELRVKAGQPVVEVGTEQSPRPCGCAARRRPAPSRGRGKAAGPSVPTGKKVRSSSTRSSAVWPSGGRASTRSSTSVPSPARSSSPRCGPGRVGERPGAVAEQLGGEQGCRDRAAVHDHERAAAPPGPVQRGRPGSSCPPRSRPRAGAAARWRRGGTRVRASSARVPVAGGEEAVHGPDGPQQRGDLRRVAPQALERVVLAPLLEEDVHDEVPVVHQDPAALRRTPRPRAPAAPPQPASGPPRPPPPAPGAATRPSR